jgi:hypothetical protein
MVTMSAATWEQLSNSSVFGGAELTMELVIPGKMKTGSVQRSKKGPNQMKKWPSGNQKSLWQATNVPAKENRQLGKQRLCQLITDVVAWTVAG